MLAVVVAVAVAVLLGDDDIVELMVTEGLLVDAALVEGLLVGKVLIEGLVVGVCPTWTIEGALDGEGVVVDETVDDAVGEGLGAVAKHVPAM